MVRAAAFDQRVVGRRDRRELSDLFAPQARGPPPATCGKVDVGGRHARSSRAKQLSEFVSGGELGRKDFILVLGVEHIDLYYLHRVDPDVPVAETVGMMGELVAEGKASHLGVSEVTVAELEQAVAAHPIAALQLEWSLTWRECEDEVIPAARRLGVGIVPYSPLGRGLLTGTVTAVNASQAAMRSRDPRFSGEALERNLELADAVATIARAHTSRPRLSLRGFWPRARTWSRSPAPNAATASPRTSQPQS